MDVGQLLQEVSSDAPCGPNLQYDSAFRELELAAAGKPEQSIGESVIPGQDPTWPDVKDRALELLRRTKDLRVAVQLTHSLLRTDGIGGLSDGLSIVSGLVERYWDSVHPQLDPEDGNDPTLRLNTLANLADWDAQVRALRELPLVSSRVLGRVSLRDVERANGSAPASGEDEDTTPLDVAAIDIAFDELDDAALEALAVSARSSVASLAKIQSVVSDKAGSAGSVDLSRLSDTLKAIDRVLSEQIARRSPAAAGNGAPGGAGRSGGLSGEVSSREDVIRLLDKACEYYRRHEPSSPIPLLLQRAKRLVSKDFLEIVKDIAPGGLSEVQSIGGVEREE
ncbi:MAG: hypothetical protein A2W00_03610 [Candidatus Eisenbacteria bacterium RBG_16_71_46]|nr:MAG: hypothetical protein A2W00_03610 [Candidatus Eisenbacteria bacterium RBG_16_71_46]OGF20957.1 MAG: hypothetical protein A2V63_10740 [Candidatus Eisenbacteria bacterium RBG_19FT_COMBO_70_11]